MIGYLDLPSGLSGDMLLGCLIDCGWPLDRLRKTIESLGLADAGWEIQVEQVQKKSLRATRVDVIAAESTQRRSLTDIVTIIGGAAIAAPVREKAIAVFRRLADAEARVHGTSAEEVHFHEVGAVDAMIDIVGSVAGLEELGITALHASAVPLGHGWTESAHGRLPLPAPATLELLTRVSAPIRPAPGPGELLTPTAAAILSELASFELPAMKLLRVGIGAGQKDFAWPNIARLWLAEAEGAGPIVQLETNIDDMNPQLYAAVLDELFRLGARDVWLTPIQMKKGRPGVTLSVLSRAADESVLTQAILRHTTTLGVRSTLLNHRHEARREMRLVQTPFGTINAKVKWMGSEAAGIMPEYDDCRRLAEAARLPVKVVYEAAFAAAQQALHGSGDGVGDSSAGSQIGRGAQSTIIEGSQYFGSTD